MPLIDRKYRELIRRTWMQTALFIILLLPLAIGLSLIWKSSPLLFSGGLFTEIITGSEWMPLQGKFGLWPFIGSSLIISLIGLLLMIPFCLGSALFITHFATPRVSAVLKSFIDILAGIPSVIFGLWGVLTVVPLIAEWATASGARNTSGYSIIAAGMVVAIAVMPFVLNMLIELFESVSMELKESALSLGASYWQTIKDVVVKKTMPGIAATFTLGVSKAFGETIAVLMVVGNVVQMPRGIFDAGYPLPALLANNYGEMMSIPQYDAALMLAALILLIIVILFNYLAHQVIQYFQSKI